MQVINIKNKRLTDEEFFRDRGQVLAEWPTGKDVDLEDGIEFQKGLPDSRVYARRLARAKSEQRNVNQYLQRNPHPRGADRTRQVPSG